MKKMKIPLFILIIFLILLGNHCYSWANCLNPRNLGFIEAMVHDNLCQAALIYIGITIISCVVFALPGITFAVFAGMIFGPWLGIILCLVATTIGAAIAFLVGRFFLKDTIKPLVRKNKYLNNILFSESSKSDLILLMITRLVPLFPYNLQNFAYGITDIGFWKYTIYTGVFMLPGVAFITIGSAGITAQSNKGVYFIIAAIIFMLVMFCGRILQRKHLGVAPKQRVI